ncbi:MAG TPA: hypothetical protein PKK60_03120, partial [archaeon]|nr:hypothetical protein [archaeon]
NNSYYISNSINCNATSGGLVGFYDNEIPLIKNSYSSTNITGTDNWSIIPDEYGDASITNSYYDSTKFSGEYTNGTGLTTSQMKQSTNFSGWDFSTIWNITNGTTYPYLRNNTQSPLPQ